MGRAALKLWMILHAHEEGLLAQLHGLYQTAVRGYAAQGQAGIADFITIEIVKLIAMAMAFADLLRAVAARQRGAGLHHARICAQAQRAALVDFIILIGHEIYHRMRTVGIELVRIRIRPADHMAGKLNHRHLHTQTNAQVRLGGFTRIARGDDHALDAALTKAAGHQNAVRFAQHFGHVALIDGFGIHIVDMYAAAQRVGCVAQRLGDGQVSVVQLHILAHHGDAHSALGMADAIHHFAPLRHIRGGRFDL